MLKRESLRHYFLKGCKAPNNLKIGVEWEKIGVHKDTGRAIPYSGPRGVRAIFKGLVRRYGWRPVLSDGKPIALKKGAASITLEPGGQIELSGRKALTLHENASELYSHLEQIKRVSDPLGIGWLGTGLQPVSRATNIEWVPKKRYAIMRRDMARSGTMSHRMMKETASIQVSLDYTDEKDAVQKLRLATKLAPFFTALFANSPVSGGRLNGLRSERALIWRHTAPERTGIIREVFKSHFGFDDYAAFALDVPMFFIIRENRWIPMRQMTFGEFMQKGKGAERATLKDWELHLTTLFTECRLRTYLEIRGVDCQKMLMGLSAPALIKGLFYEPQAMKKIWGLVADMTIEELEELRIEAPRSGLQTPFRGRPIESLAQKLVWTAHEGLERLGRRDSRLKNDLIYLEPLEKLVLKGRSPADEIIDRFRVQDPVQLLSL